MPFEFRTPADAYSFFANSNYKSFKDGSAEGLRKEIQTVEDLYKKDLPPESDPKSSEPLLPFQKSGLECIMRFLEVKGFQA